MNQVNKYSSKCTANTILYKCVWGFLSFFQSRAARYKYIRTIKSTSNAVGDILEDSFAKLTGQEMKVRIQVIYISLICSVSKKTPQKIS